MIKLDMFIKIESGNVMNIDMIKQEIEIDQDLDKIDDTNGKINPFCKVIVNKVERNDTIISQME